MLDTKLPQRKHIRLKEYDYSQNGSYFITVCTEKRRSYLWDVGAIINRPQTDYSLSKYGLVVDRYINEIPYHYSHARVDKYVIMSNHFHMILSLDTFEENGGRLIIAPTYISKIVQQLKRAVSKEIGFSIWQKSFYEHIIRSEQDYRDIWQYIDNNPAKWIEDEYYSE